MRMHVLRAAVLRPRAGVAVDLRLDVLVALALVQRAPHVVVAGELVQGRGLGLGEEPREQRLHGAVALDARDVGRVRRVHDAVRVAAVRALGDHAVAARPLGGAGDALLEQALEHRADDHAVLAVPVLEEHDGRHDGVHELALPVEAQVLAPEHGHRRVLAQLRERDLAADALRGGHARAPEPARPQRRLRRHLRRLLRARLGGGRRRLRAPLRLARLALLG
mmetsp:Transcript_31780/g.107816  ORF Transcript_31780/g.107816 Transcript_31780/m.107816 type:complete len:222 (+) Transcript_31780:1570-2235(+)